MKNTCPNDIFTCPPPPHIEILMSTTLLACPILATVLSSSFKMFARIWLLLALGKQASAYGAPWSIHVNFQQMPPTAKNEIVSHNHVPQFLSLIWHFFPLSLQVQRSQPISTCHWLQRGTYQNQWPRDHMTSCKMDTRVLLHQSVFNS